MRVSWTLPLFVPELKTSCRRAAEEVPTWRMLTRKGFSNSVAVATDLRAKGPGGVCDSSATQTPMALQQPAIQPTGARVQLPAPPSPAAGAPGEEEKLASLVETSLEQHDADGVCDGMRLLFASQKRKAKAALQGGAGGSSPPAPRVLHAVARSLECAHASTQVGELASGWLSLVVDKASRALRASVLGTPGLVDNLCCLAENGSAQARVFAGMCLRELHVGMGLDRALALISMPSFPPCINSMLCSPIKEEQLSGTLILAELIGEGGERAVNCIFGACAVAMASLLGTLEASVHSGNLAALWCVGRLARTTSGRIALREAGITALMLSWVKSHEFTQGRSPEFAFEARGLLLIAIVNATATKDFAELGQEAAEKFQMPVHTLTPLLATACQNTSRAWTSEFLRLDLWEILYTLSLMLRRRDAALEEESLASCMLEFVLYSFQEAVGELGLLHEQQYKVDTSQDPHAWERWDLALEHMGRCLYSLAGNARCHELMRTSGLVNALQVFAFLLQQGRQRALVRHLPCHAWVPALTQLLAGESASTGDAHGEVWSVSPTTQRLGLRNAMNSPGSRSATPPPSIQLKTQSESSDTLILSRAGQTQGKISQKSEPHDPDEKTTVGEKLAVNDENVPPPNSGTSASFHHTKPQPSTAFSQRNVHNSAESGTTASKNMRSSQDTRTRAAYASEPLVGQADANRNTNRPGSTAHERLTSPQYQVLEKTVCRMYKTRTLNRVVHAWSRRSSHTSHLSQLVQIFAERKMKGPGRVTAVANIFWEWNRVCIITRGLVRSPRMGRADEASVKTQHDANRRAHGYRNPSEEELQDTQAEFHREREKRRSQVQHEGMHAHALTVEEQMGLNLRQRSLGLEDLMKVLKDDMDDVSCALQRHGGYATQRDRESIRTAVLAGSYPGTDNQRESCPFPQILQKPTSPSSTPIRDSSVINGSGEEGPARVMSSPQFNLCLALQHGSNADAPVRTCTKTSPGDHDGVGRVLEVRNRGFSESLTLEEQMKSLRSDMDDLMSHFSAGSPVGQRNHPLSPSIGEHKTEKQPLETGSVDVSFLLDLPPPPKSPGRSEMKWNEFSSSWDIRGGAEEHRNSRRSSDVIQPPLTLWEGATRDYHEQLHDIGQAPSSYATYLGGTDLPAPLHQIVDRVTPPELHRQLAGKAHSQTAVEVPYLPRPRYYGASPSQTRAIFSSMSDRFPQSHCGGSTSVCL